MTDTNPDFWEYICGDFYDSTHKMKVEGGWIYRHTRWTLSEQDMSNPGSFAVAMVFVPNCGHK